MPVLCMCTVCLPSLFKALAAALSPLSTTAMLLSGACPLLFLLNGCAWQRKWATDYLFAKQYTVVDCSRSRPEHQIGSCLNVFLFLTQATEEGLDSAEVKRRLDQYGYNKLPESTRIPFLVFLGYLWNPLSWAMEVAALLAIILLDYADFALIVALLLVNATIRCGCALQ